MRNGRTGHCGVPLPNISPDKVDAWIATKTDRNGRFEARRVSVRVLLTLTSTPPSMDDLLDALRPLLEKHDGDWRDLDPILCTANPTQNGKAVNLESKGMKGTTGMKWCSLRSNNVSDLGQVWRPSTQDDPLYLAFRCPHCSPSVVKVLSPSQLSPGKQRCHDCGKKASGGTKGKRRRVDASPLPAGPF